MEEIIYWSNSRRGGQYSDKFELIDTFIYSDSPTSTNTDPRTDIHVYIPTHTRSNRSTHSLDKNGFLLVKLERLVPP